MTPLLEIRGLSLHVRQGRRTVSILSDVDLSIAEGESLGVVGESGSGKSMTLRTVAGLRPRGAVLAGQVSFDGNDVLALSSKKLRAYRSRDIAVIPQNPLATINPLRTVGDFLVEALVSTGAANRSEAGRRAVDALVSVGIGDAERRLRQYPHELSGGLLQRVAIAAALLAQPRLILADEPTTALDVTTQEEVIAILADLRRERNAALLLVTHDLDLAAAVTDRLAVVYAGVVVETAPSRDIHLTARHPYTAGLLAARPVSYPPSSAGPVSYPPSSARPTDTSVDRLPTIPGRPASAAEAGDGCVFAARCPFAVAKCRSTRPERHSRGSHLVACHRVDELPTPVVFPARHEVAS